MEAGGDEDLLTIPQLFVRKWSLDKTMGICLCMNVKCERPKEKCEQHLLNGRWTHCAFLYVVYVSVFVYDLRHKKWYVYCSGSRNGYICLLGE